MTPLLENPYIEALAGARKLLERAAVGPGMYVLDVGCGPGRLTLPAAERVGPAGGVVAVELQPKMLRRLRGRLTERTVDNVETILGGIGEVSLGSERFDRAFLVTVLGEIVDKRGALEAIHAALKPGGVLSVTELLPDPHYQSRTTVRALAQAVGFQPTESFGTWFAFTLNFRKATADR
jgi:ubiquinone/menaquinone biosynthesis C-methylase UbiE